MVATVPDIVCCTICRIPVDAEHFDVSGCIHGDDIPRRPGEQRVLAAFQLHPQYCGVLNYFVQFTDLYARDNSEIQTPGFEWIIRQNGKPLFPYIRLDLIINPWGQNYIPVSVRLDENARLEFVIRKSESPPGQHEIRKFAGRLIGRYWYNQTYGGRER